jgi:hypothetical protein
VPLVIFSKDKSIRFRLSRRFNASLLMFANFSHHCAEYLPPITPSLPNATTRDYADCPARALFIISYFSGALSRVADSQRKALLEPNRRRRIAIHPVKWPQVSILDLLAHSRPQLFANAAIAASRVCGIAVGQMVAGGYGNSKNLHFIVAGHVGGGRYDSVDLDRGDTRIRGHRGSASPCALGTQPN